MFVGHYGVSFALKGRDARIPLWFLFIAVQLVDVGWALLVLAGVEKVRIAPGITASNPLDLYYMPYTHSLVASVVWAAVAGTIYRLRGSWRGSALLVGLAVLSHWFLDLLVHRADLPLYDDAAKVGLGLWNYRAAALSLEATLLFGGLVWYLRHSTPRRRIGTYGFITLGLLMLAIQVQVFFGTPPESDVAAALTALAAYLIFAALAGWLERARGAAPLR